MPTRPPPTPASRHWLRRQRFEKYPAGRPPDRGREILLAGRSNAGKSSVLNVLAGRRKLARSGKTPGCTRTMQYFLLDEERRLVDAPGYGYAQGAALSAGHRQQELLRYLRGRRALCGVVVVMDIRHPLTPLDKWFLEQTSAQHLPVRILLNKSDKLGYGAAQRTLGAVRAKCAPYPGLELQLFSTRNGTGHDPLYSTLAGWLR